MLRPETGKIPANIYFNLKGGLEDDRQRGGSSGNDEKENHRPPEFANLRHESRVVLEATNLFGHLNLICKADVLKDTVHQFRLNAIADDPSIPTAQIAIRTTPRATRKSPYPALFRPFKDVRD